MLGKLEIEVSLAKPPSENKKKEQRKNMQNRMMMMGGPGYGYGGFVTFSLSKGLMARCLGLFAQMVARQICNETRAGLQVGAPAKLHLSQRLVMK